MNYQQLDGLLVLKTVAEKRNFTAAANDLGITASAVSQIVKQLESRIGVALLNRTTRSVSVTEAGERFLAQAGPAMDQLLAALSNVGEYAETPSGLLRINLPRALYESYISPRVVSFQKKYPQVSVELYFEDGTSDIVEQGFDAGIRLSDILQKDMVAVKLIGPVRFVTVAAPKYLNKYGRPKHPKDLLAHNCLMMRLSPDRIYDRWEFEHRGSEFQVQVKGSLMLNDTTFLRQACLEGRGMMYGALDSIEPYVRSGKLEIVLESYSAISTGFYLYYPRKSQVLPKLRAFIDHLKEV